MNQQIFTLIWRIYPHVLQCSANLRNLPFQIAIKCVLWKFEPRGSKLSILHCSSKMTKLLVLIFVPSLLLAQREKNRLKYDGWSKVGRENWTKELTRNNFIPMGRHWSKRKRPTRRKKGKIMEMLTKNCQSFKRRRRARVYQNSCSANALHARLAVVIELHQLSNTQSLTALQSISFRHYFLNITLILVLF